MIIAAISDFTDNATVFHDKRLLLDLLTATVMLLQVLCRVAMRSRLLSSLSFPLLGFRATVASSVLPAESSWSCPPPALGLAAAIGRDGSDCRLPWERSDTCMPCASAQQGSNNVSDWWKRWKQLCPLYLGTLQSGTSHVELDCVSVQDLNDLFNNTRCNWFVCAPTKVGGLLFHSSSAQWDPVLQSTPHVCCSK